MCGHAAAAPDTARWQRTPLSWSLGASLVIPVSPKLVQDLYDPGFNFAGGAERRFGHSLALTGRLEYTGFPFNSGSDPFNQTQAIEAQAGQLNVFDLLVGARIGPPGIYGYVGAGGSYASGEKIQLIAVDSGGNLLSREFDPGGSGLAARAGAGTTFGTKQRYTVELGWSMLQAQDRIQSVAISAGVMMP